MRLQFGGRAFMQRPSWTGGRVVEGARLESVYTGNRIAGSNPALSAISSKSLEYIDVLAATLVPCNFLQLQFDLPS